MNALPYAMESAIGKTVIAEDIITAGPVANLMATFGVDNVLPKLGMPLPLLWHGLFCTSTLSPSRLGADGLPRNEVLLPETDLFPNKLFGGARFDFRGSLHVGDQIIRESEVMSFDVKSGKSGPFILCRVQHRISNTKELAVIEENDIIFRPPSPQPQRMQASVFSRGASLPPPEWSRLINPDPILMFRHSAVTFNSHRVHYDRDYAREKGHPGLLVQGMLIARLMLHFLEKELVNYKVSNFAFKSMRPIYDVAEFTIAGAHQDRNVTMWAIDQTGEIGMTALASGVFEKDLP